MKTSSFALAIFSAALLAGSATGQVSWLDRPLTTNWNNSSGAVPQAPRTLAPIEGRCRDQIRAPESLADRAMTRAGWNLFGPSQSYGATTVVMAMASVDGMCRPNQFNGFVFVRNRFVGTLAPEPMMARSDGSLGRIYLSGASEISADFARYTSRDPLCCPSQTSNVTYSIGSGVRPVLKADDVNTSPVCREDQGGDVGTMDNVVSGTVTYRQRSALPPNAVLTVRIMDVSRADTSATVIAESRIPLDGKQVPISFDLAYERNRIVERNTYAVQAEIRDGNRLLFTTDTRYPVITQGNPRNVEVTVVPVGGAGNRDTVVRGTVTYRERIALPPNSEVFVRLVDSATPEGSPVAQTSFSTGNRQVPIAFELPYENRDINRQRDYVLFAEIRSGGQLRFKTATGVPVTLRGNQDQNIEIVVVQAEDGPPPITGRALNISRFGTGSLAITGRSAWPLISATVSVDNDGNATVSLGRIGNSVSFSGKMTAYDSGRLTITVSNSGDADSSGQITATFNGRRLGNLSSTDLMLDGQTATLRF